MKLVTIAGRRISKPSGCQKVDNAINETRQVKSQLKRASAIAKQIERGKAICEQNPDISDMAKQGIMAALINDVAGCVIIPFPDYPLAE